MAKVGAQRAAVLTGKSKSTIQRAMNSGKLSYALDQNDRRVIDVSELERVFGIKPESLNANSGDAPAAVQDDIEKERLSLEIKLLELRLENAQEQIEDLRDQRDKWENQANQVLLTTQHTHKQIEDLRIEIREMDQKIKPKRSATQGSTDQTSVPAAKKISAGNQNANNNSGASRFMFWKKAKA